MIPQSLSPDLVQIPPPIPTIDHYRKFRCCHRSHSQQCICYSTPGHRTYYSNVVFHWRYVTAQHNAYKQRVWRYRHG
ncbi:hypothetical protein CJU90_4977 [Yarrowia sp. C11]|nr:hypothetical protein CJU90_4977 [Yarrowia sp. C11]